MERWIYHFTPRELYDRAVATGFYTHDSLGKQGFIHCSTREQVVHVANFIARGVRGLVLLKIDAARVQPEIRYENLEGGKRLFPHIYGPLNLDALAAVLDFEPDENGVFHMKE